MQKQILEAVLKLFGDKIIWDGEKWFGRSLPMSQNDWDVLRVELKNTIDGYKRWPSKYTQKWPDNFGFEFREVHFTKLFEDIYGDSWYFDDVDLVQSDRTIVTIKKNMTFKEMYELIEKSPRLERK